MAESEKSEPELTEIKNKKQKKKNIADWVEWVTFNWIFPFCFPIICIVIAILLNDKIKISDFKLEYIVKMAYLSGAYIFVGATVLISLFYKIKAKKIIEFGFLFLVLLLLSLFYSNAEQIDNEIKIISRFNLQDYWGLFFIITILCFAISIEKRIESPQKNKL